MDVHEALGIIAGILSFIPGPIYVWAILRGETKPDRVTWWILALVSFMIALSYGYTGASETIWLPIGYAASFTIVALFSLKYGDGPLKLHPLDRICLLGALISAFIWWFSGSAEIALYLNILTEMIGLAPTIQKSWERPWTEDKTAWVITTIASILNVLALPTFALVAAIYPLYVLLTNAAITALLFRPRRI